MALGDPEQAFAAMRLSIDQLTPTSQPYAVLRACVQSLLIRATVADDAHSDRNQVAQFSSALGTLPAGQVVPEMPAATCKSHHDRAAL
jgi:hypothetical protein